MFKNLTYNSLAFFRSSLRLQWLPGWIWGWKMLEEIKKRLPTLHIPPAKRMRTSCPGLGEILKYNPSFRSMKLIQLQGRNWPQEQAFPLLWLGFTSQASHSTTWPALPRLVIRMEENKCVKMFFSGSRLSFCIPLSVHKSRRRRQEGACGRNFLNIKSMLRVYRIVMNFST